MAAGLATIALVAVACGGDDDATSSDAAGGGGRLTTINVGVLPVVDVAPLFVAREQGYFEEEGLRVEPQLGESGAALLPSVLSGDNKFAYVNTVSLLIARSKNLPVKAVAQGATGAKTQDKDHSAVFVRKNSPVREPKDLEGKTIGVNALNNIATLTISATLEKEGVDPKSLKFLEVPIPEVPSAVENGRVDAGQTVEPFVTIAESQGARRIAGNFAGTAPDLTTAMYFTSESYIKQEPEIVKGFARAIERALEYSNQHPEAVRKVLGQFTEIKPGVAEKILLPGFTPSLNRTTIQTVADLAKKYGYIDRVPNVDELIWEGAHD